MTLVIPRFLRTVDLTLTRVLDPFGFQQMLEGLELHPDELPSLHRERRLEGIGL